MAGISNILVLGAGELGTQVLSSLAKHPQSDNITITVLLRPSSISSKVQDWAQPTSLLHDQNISTVPGDLTNDSQESLSQIFRQYDTIISCTGFAAGRGTQRKLAHAVLAAKVPRYIPWQFGVDYDIIGRGSAQDLLTNSWIFLFEPWFGVVDLKNNAVCALGSWDTAVTVTAPEDIGEITAEILLGDKGETAFTNNAIFIAGDTLSYANLALLLEKATGKPVQRTLRTVQSAQTDLAKEPTNEIYKYQIVFGEGRGVSWDLSKTWNHENGILGLTVKEYMARYL
ncbi:uncharacterized protein N7506_011999 [Penicillium brevicompactum]|uniref:uncharacterized protein n=1 Tax=Penicillium brevicompactum TaxID=5074 RepID=UPI0025400B21|nr:uncharacterized protein N7506_011999 [Penicillium brevicompactum]KAJ5319295.1 hypothetical protein N7506_011999 [Penicillium brevicompactum]